MKHLEIREMFDLSEDVRIIQRGKDKYELIYPNGLTGNLFVRGRKKKTSFILKQKEV